MNKGLKQLQASLFACLFLSACQPMVLLHPAGVVGDQEKNLIILTTCLMLLVVLPAIIMTFYFAYKYRAANPRAEYIPNWYSKPLELGFWIIPGIITIVIAIITWNKSHTLDPFKSLDAAINNLQVQVIALDWKWLFIFPDYGVATVNEIRFPINTPVHFYITSHHIMNSFFIPQLGSQIMAMPGMQTQLFLMAQTPGIYQGISANFSGYGFTGMKFSAIALNQDEFLQWISKIKQSATHLDDLNFQKLTVPSTNQPVQYFSNVETPFFKAMMDRYHHHHSLKGVA